VRQRRVHPLVSLTLEETMLTEFNPSTEHVTAIITSHLTTGENFDGAIAIGIYPENSAEVWIQAQGITVNVQLADIDNLCRQLKRAKKIASEQKTE
jgi:hypothetical protein